MTISSSSNISYYEKWWLVPHPFPTFATGNIFQFLLTILFYPMPHTGNLNIPQKDPFHSHLFTYTVHDLIFTNLYQGIHNYSRNYVSCNAKLQSAINHLKNLQCKRHSVWYWLNIIIEIQFFQGAYQKDGLVYGV